MQTRDRMENEKLRREAYHLDERIRFNLIYFICADAKKKKSYYFFRFEGKICIECWLLSMWLDVDDCFV